MRTLSVDVAVIGAGTAGLSARREAARAGARVVLIEAGPYGTTCARVGCMPSKLLIAAASVAHEAAGAHRFGVEPVGGVRIDGRAVMRRLQGERDRFVGGVLRAVETILPKEKLRGEARFLGPTSLRVGDQTRVEAKAIVIATGAHPSIPAVLEPVRERVLTNDSLFDLDDLPDSIGVLGAGPVGIELGQALHRLGVRTMLFDLSDRIALLSDPEVGRSAREVLGAELDLRLNTEARFERTPDGGVRATWQGGEARFDYLLAATGRPPNLAALDLEKTGLALDDKGLPAFDRRTLRCGDSPIFIAGDANADRPLLHEAADEGSVAGHNAACYPDLEAPKRRAPLSIVFTEPQIAVVGTPFEELEEGRIEIGMVDYRDQGRARVIGRNAGIVRIYGRRGDNRLLGAEMFGPGVEHTAHLLAWAIQNGLTAAQVLEMPFYHPTFEEGIRSAIRDLCACLHIMPEERPEDLESGPGA